MPNLNLRTKLKVGTGASLIHNDITDFPTSPQDGEMVMKNGILYVYSTIDGITTWFPLTNKKALYVHQQSTPSKKWTIDHNFNTQDFGYFVYDESHNLLTSNNIVLNDNTFVLVFHQELIGMVVVVANSEFDAPTLTSNSITTDAIVVAGTVEINSSGISLDNENILDTIQQAKDEAVQFSIIFNG